jgi:hypothetical protein
MGEYRLVFLLGGVVFASDAPSMAVLDSSIKGCLLPEEIATREASTSVEAFSMLKFFRKFPLAVPSLWQAVS